MAYNNAQSETSRTRTDKEECEPSADPRQLGGTRHSSSTVWGEPISPSGNDWSATNTFDNPGDVFVGGTVQQLIAETRSEIQEIEDRGEKLRKRLTQLEDLVNRLQNVITQKP